MGQCASAAYGEDYEALERATAAARRDGITTMHVAAAANDLSTVLALGEKDEKLGRPGRSVNATSNNGEIYMLDGRRFQLVAAPPPRSHVPPLRPAFVGPPLSPCPPAGSTPLHAAAQHGAVQAIRALIALGGNMKAADDAGGRGREEGRAVVT